MMRPIPVKIETIYIPRKWHGTLDDAKVETLAESIIDEGLQKPIHVRESKDRYVLVHGYHRLEAMRALGEEKIPALVVAAPKMR